MLETKAERAAQIILGTGCVTFDIENPKTLTSGIKSPTYTNLRPFPSHPLYTGQQKLN